MVNGGGGGGGGTNRAMTVCDLSKPSASLTVLNVCLCYNNNFPINKRNRDGEEINERGMPIKKRVTNGGRVDRGWR